VAAFGVRGRPGGPPSRLALVTILQQAEKLTDRQRPSLCGPDRLAYRPTRSSLLRLGKVTEMRKSRRFAAIGAAAVIAAFGLTCAASSASASDESAVAAGPVAVAGDFTSVSASSPSDAWTVGCAFVLLTTAVTPIWRSTGTETWKRVAVRRFPEPVAIPP